MVVVAVDAIVVYADFSVKVYFDDNVVTSVGNVVTSGVLALITNQSPR